MDENPPRRVQLPLKQEKAAQLIASGISQTAAAAHPDISISKQSMNRWCKEETFQLRVMELTASDTGRTVAEIIAGGQEEAAKVILNTVKGVVDPDPKVAKMRFDAAKYVLDMLKVKKMPEETKTNRATRKTEFTPAETAEMMGPIEEEDE